MLTSVIIPASSNKAKELYNCLTSIAHAADRNMRKGHATEVVVSYPDNEPPPPKRRDLNLFVAYVPHSTAHGLKLAPCEADPYWKAKALNVGLDNAHGDVLAFLDADAIIHGSSLSILEFLVRPRKEGFRCFKDAKQKKVKRQPKVSTKAAYRVKYITPEQVGMNQADLWKIAPVAFEGLYKADTDIREYKEEPPIDRRLHFGNSQFAVTREWMGDLRWDENYVGRGFEDIDINARMAFKHGSDYRCQLITTCNEAMFHVKTPMPPGYASGRWSDRNRRRYYGERFDWYCCPNASMAEKVTLDLLRKGEGSYKVVWPPNDKWELSAINKGLDVIFMVDENGEIKEVTE